MKIDYKTAYENVLTANKMLEKEIERLNNTIKEVRDYILQHCEIIRDEEKNIDMVGRIEGIPLLEILDKADKGE